MVATAVAGSIGSGRLSAETALDVVAALEPADLADLFAMPLLAVDVARSRPEHLAELAGRRPPLVLLGVGTAADPVARAAAGQLDVLADEITGRDPGTVLAELGRATAAHPVAAVSLVTLLRASEGLNPLDGLVTESLTYSMLLAGADFARWLAAQKPRTYRPSDTPVLVRRAGRVLRLTLNRPEVRNAYDTGTRDALVAALRAARVAPDIDEVRLDAVGPAFGAGGDLSQFGTTPDLAAAHLVRTGANAGAEIVRCPWPVTAYLHGSCVGAGIEVPAFADRVVAAADTTMSLPELSMGLVPGAGGTVSVTRRIGRRRAGWFMLTGCRLDAATAAAWGLVDEVNDH